MKRKRSVHSAHILETDFFDDIIHDFATKGEDYGNQKRNTLKLFMLNDFTINVKSFRVPNLVNQIAYRFFRKSKAQRSYEYANKLLTLGIRTPQPIAYYEFHTLFLFKKSYYISEQLDCDLTYRELTTDFDYPNYETILRAFTRFTYQLHEKGVKFLDHSPGNTLINKNGEDYDFYLVDLNRMQFGSLDFETRIKNFARLTKHKSMVEVMSDEYAKCIGKPYDTVFNAMWRETEAFQEKYHRKKRLKQKLKI
ncbi:lipopolysaccharide kinase InaA family protein [Gelidibacter salicanalis]|uniref:Kdo domain containing protein n=1 Tax=Gelidibacter salicanalis TaxID=291193 RepID=A0A934NGA4_9FLAO|nr:lipopolysaccharide kinase InaA family protein [Gelidibacter salicanalis]MBJ7879346.1 Kdo domain containing protein [Gelidibacter salicanalis]